MSLITRQNEATKQGAGNSSGAGARGCAPGSRVRLQRGFTLIELAMVIVIVGILAVFIAPRFFDADIFRSRGFADQVQASLRYAQKAAIAQRRNVCVALTPSDITLTIASAGGAAGACDKDLVSPTGGPYKIGTPSASIALAYSSATFGFDALGRTAARQTVTIGSATIIVEAETGYVH